MGWKSAKVCGKVLQLPVDWIEPALHGKPEAAVG